MSHGYRRLSGGVLLVMATVATSTCGGGEELVGPNTGTLEVTSSTTGAELDVDGYTVQLDGLTPRPLGPTATLRLSGITPGPHSILLDGLTANCSVAGDNLRSISVTAGQTTTIFFAVTCSATTGRLHVTTATTGPSPDPDGYAVSLDGTSRGALATSGETTIDGLTPGTHTVGIGGVSGNCQVEENNPRTVTIPPGATAEAAFTIVCQAPPLSSGTIEVKTVTGGTGIDADGYAFSVDGGGTQPIGVNAVAGVSSVGAGVHIVELSGIADHCTLEGTNPRSVTVPSDGTVTVSFSVNCQATTGGIQVITSTSGPDLDTDGYAFAVDGESLQSIEPDATVTVLDLAAGVHNVTLSGVAASCTVQGANPRTVTVTAGSTVPVRFDVACTAGSIMITTNPPVSALNREVFDPVVQPVIQLSDGSGGPVAGAQVTVRIASGTGVLEGTTTALTTAGGVAAFIDLGIRGTGDHTLEFTAGASTVTSAPISVSALTVEATKGQWGPVVDWDIVPLHMSLMPSGKIVAWGKTERTDTMGMPRVWNPASGPPSGAPMIDVDTMLFCAGHTLMPDGRLMVSGGHLKDGFGIAVTNFFSPDGTWSKGPNMAHGRWYPTVTVLEDGRILTMAGRNQQNQVVKIPEIWENGRWVELPGGSNVEIPYYPRNFVDPKNGQIFNAGERVQSRWFNPDGSSAGGRGSWTSGPIHKFGFNRDYGSAVMYESGKILVVGGGGMTNWPTPDPKTGQPTNSAEIIDLNASSPSWQNTASMTFRRRHMNATVLPDGQVLATGGTSGGGTGILTNIDPALAVHEAEIWNPSTGQWTTLARNNANVMRLYHSVSLLLPDGTVLNGASGDAKTIGPAGGEIDVPPERNHEIFSPPYLFQGARPAITSAPANIGYGQTFTLATPNAAQITAVRWIKLGSVTHAFDASTRANSLKFASSGGNLQVTAPSSSRVAPPGHYMLFILNRNGVPSKGKIVRIQ